MANAEGRRDPFVDLYSYMRKPPAVIFYDFSCGLAEYAMNREPLLFQHTKFVVDAFHWSNHTCSPCYNPKRLPGICNVNGSTAEQCNSFLSIFQQSMGGMKLSSFMLTLQHVIKMHNEWKDAKTREEWEKLFGTALP
jgi:hypothetical protein